MVGTGRRIRRRNGVSSTRYSSRDNATNDTRRFQLMFIGGVFYLAITFTTRTISINAFPFQRSSLSPMTTSQVPSVEPWLRQNHELNPCAPAFSPPNHRYHTFLLATKPNDNESPKSSATASLIDSTIDAGSIASMDPDYQKYKESLLNPQDDDNNDDSELYKDFEKFYSPFSEESNNDSSAASDDTKSSEGKEDASDGSDVAVVEKTEEIDQFKKPVRPAVGDIPVHMRPLEGFNVVLTHCTADFDSLASAVGLAKLWTSKRLDEGEEDEDDDDGNDYDRTKSDYPTFVVLPRGAHPAVQRFLALHKHLFPIRSLKNLPDDLSKLHRLALVDAQRKDRIGPAEVLLKHADRITVVDHHVDMESDIPGITDYVVDGVGSVSTLIVERLMRQQDKQLQRQLENSSAPITTLTEAEATLLALGIHADTGSLCFDSTTPRDATALAWVMHQGASQVAIAEHAQSSLSREQQAVLTQAIVNANSTVAHGVTVSTVLLTADGFINGLAAVTQDAMELSSADVFLLGVVYEPKSGRGGKSKRTRQPGIRVKSKLLLTGARKAAAKKKAEAEETKQDKSFPNKALTPSAMYKSQLAHIAEEKRQAQERLRTSFDEKDLDGNGYIDQKEMSKALVASGIIATEETVLGLMQSIDTNKDGIVDFDEFLAFASTVQSSIVTSNSIEAKNNLSLPPSEDTNESSEKGKKDNISSPSSTLIIIGRAKPGVNMKSVKLGKLLEKYGGGGHPKAASATVRLEDESEAQTIMSGLVDELIETSLQEQSTVGDFMTSPVLSVRDDMSENQVEDLFNRYDVRALPVVNEDHEVIGLVTYKEVSAAKQRMWNKEQKRLRQEQQRKEREAKEGAKPMSKEELEKQAKIEQRRSKNPTVKAWMKQHIKTVEASMTMAEVEAILLENDVGCIPVVMDGTQLLVGMVTRTDLLRQHRYYPSLHYNNKGMADSIASRKHIVALRKKLKQFDLDE
mmetsp:Transcript_3442/g.8192  ORF Transcript_3442/g.8192 Transcript_3442/m.8192 type:complete len:971 (+) Transcript_3442:297-3209(+)